MKTIMMHANMMCAPLKINLMRVSAWRPMHSNVAYSLSVWTGKIQLTLKGYVVR